MQYKKLSKKILKHLTLYSLIILVTLVFSYLGFLIYYKDKIYPGIKVANYNLGGMSAQESQSLISSNIISRINTPLLLKNPDGSSQFEINLKLASPHTNNTEAVAESYKIGRGNNFIFDLQEQLQSLVLGKNIPLSLKYDRPEALSSQINSISQALTQDPKDATITLQGEVTSSIDGSTLDTEYLNENLEKYLKLETEKLTLLPIKVLPAYFNTQRANLAKKALEDAKNSPIKITYDKNEWVINEKVLFSLLDTKQTKGLPETNLKDEERLLNKEKLDEFTESISSKVYKPMQNARFEVENLDGKLKVKEFQAAQSGIEIDKNKLKDQILKALISSEDKQISLSVRTTHPEVTTDSANNLGIEGLLGEGLSYFAGSIPNRVYNVGLAASRINGTLVAPNETFSFVNTIGDITGATGYKPAYVIKSGRTVLDDGGGVCQVSTTLFRAVLNAGLPVVSRTAHAYRVGYYEQGFPPGLDATIFYPSVDFKFKNDTGNYLLIQTEVVGTSLTVNIYGKPDGRVSTLTTSIVTNQTPAPPDLRQDDPTLPKGTAKQVDWAANGANVRFSRSVTRGQDKLIEETFYSNYRPWQAVYLVGTQ